MSAHRTLRIDDLFLTVVVSGGTGYVDFDFTGWIHQLAAKDVNATDGWTPQIERMSGSTVTYPVWKAVGACTGNAPVAVDAYTKEKNRLTITGDDNTYVLLLTGSHGI